MLRLITSLVVVAALAGPLLTGTAHAQAPPVGPCIDFTLEDAPDLLPRVAMVVIGSVTEVVPGEQVAVAPEAFLEGPTSTEAVVLPVAEGDAECTPADIPLGERVLLVLGRESGQVVWPGATQVFLLRSGVATQLGSDGVTIDEEELVDRIRGETGQFSIPAQSNEEGARLDWFGTVIPVTAAVLVVLAIGLVLMREWHRIDPT